MKNNETMQPEIEESINEFESFLKTVGFKRIEGSIYGLLVLSSEAMTLEEIHKALSISQGAASQGLKALHQWGAIESKYHSDKRAQVHQATEDSLRIVSTIFRKREQMAITQFKNNAVQTRSRLLEMGEDANSLPIRRLDSIILTCNTADAVMNFVESLSQVGNYRHYQKVIRALPVALDALILGGKTTKHVANKLKERISSIRN